MHVRLFSLAAVLFSLGSPASAAELTGTVLHVDGTPAQGATVWAAAVFVSPPLRRHTITDARGKFRFDLQPLEKNAARWHVFAMLGHRGGEIQRLHGGLEIHEGDPPAPVVIRLEERGLLRGRVLRAEDDQPIPNCRLFISSGEVVTTDAQGRYEVGGLPPMNHALVPVAPGRARNLTLFDTTLRPNAELDIRLPRAGKITGRVLDEAGQPIAGAYVTRQGSGNALAMNGWSDACAADGSFVFDGLPLHYTSFSLSAFAPGHEPGTHEFDTMRGQAAHRHTFHLRRAPRSEDPKQATPRSDFTGLVLGADKKPLADAVVRWGANTMEPLRRTARTNAEGKFTLRDVPEDDGFITITAKGHAPLFHAVRFGERTAEVTLDKEQFVGGIVRSRKGQPIANVCVSAFIAAPNRNIQGNFSAIREPIAFTDPQGRFELRGLPETDVYFNAYKHGFTTPGHVALTMGEKENIIEFGRQSAIRGLVLDPEGKAVRDFRIRIQTPRWQLPNDRDGGFYVGYDSLGISFTSDDGTFVVSDFGEPGGWVRVSAIAPGYGQATFDRVQTHEADDLPPATDLVFRLKPPHALRVRALDARTQRPLADALVKLLDDELEHDEGPFVWGYDDLGGHPLRTDADGWADFGKLALSEATMIVQRPGYARQRFGWRDGQKEFRVNLQPEAVLTGTFQVDKEPRRDLFANLRRQTGDSFSAVVDRRTGRFRLDQLPAGDYTLKLQSWRNPLFFQEVKLQAGATLDLKPTPVDSLPLPPGIPAKK